MTKANEMHYFSNLFG